jgi:hypothetical protein
MGRMLLASGASNQLCGPLAGELGPQAVISAIRTIKIEYIQRFMLHLLGHESMRANTGMTLAIWALRVKAAESCLPPKIDLLINVSWNVVRLTRKTETILWVL